MNRCWAACKNKSAMAFTLVNVAGHGNEFAFARATDSMRVSPSLFLSLSLSLTRKVS